MYVRTGTAAEKCKALVSKIKSCQLSLDLSVSGIVIHVRLEQTRTRRLKQTDTFAYLSSSHLLRHVALVLGSQVIPPLGDHAELHLETRKKRQKEKRREGLWCECVNAKRNKR